MRFFNNRTAGDSLGCSPGATDRSDVDTVLEKYIKAGNPDTSPEELMLLASDDIDHVRRRVGENLRTPIEVLARLSEDGNAEVRIAVGENPATPPAVLAKLVADHDPDVRYSLAENPHVPASFLHQLAEDDNPYVSHRAKRTLRLLQPSGVRQLKPRETGADTYITRDFKLP